MTHRDVSFVKSGLRVFGYMFLVIYMPLGVFILIFAEALGVVEELV